MKRRRSLLRAGWAAHIWASLVAAIALILFAPSPQTARAQSQQIAFGRIMYQQRCASCHEDPQDRTPPRSLLAQLSPEAIVTALLTGTMKIQGERLGAEQIHAIALFLTGKAVGTASEKESKPNNCTDKAPIQVAATQWNGWGRDLDNSRYQPSPGFAAQDLGKLKLKWAFGYPGIMTYGQPTIMGGCSRSMPGPGALTGALTPAARCVPRSA